VPLFLEPVDVLHDLEGVRSVLIVSCPICPAFSLAMRQTAPLVDVAKSGLKPIALRDHVAKLRKALESQGVRTEAFTIYAPIPMMCLWTQRQHRRLAKQARRFEAALVLGCESAAYTATQALKDTGCKVVQAMRLQGITNATIGYERSMKLVLRDKARVPVSIAKPGAHSAVQPTHRTKEATS
jgi:hypothetical protein